MQGAFPQHAAFKEMLMNWPRLALLALVAGVVASGAGRLSAQNAKAPPCAPPSRHRRRRTKATYSRTSRRAWICRAASRGRNGMKSPGARIPIGSRPPRGRHHPQSMRRRRCRHRDRNRWPLGPRIGRKTGRRGKYMDTGRPASSPRCRRTRVGIPATSGPTWTDTIRKRPSWTGGIAE